MPAWCESCKRRMRSKDVCLSPLLLPRPLASGHIAPVDRDPVVVGATLRLLIGDNGALRQSPYTRQSPAREGEDDIQASGRGGGTAGIGSRGGGGTAPGRGGRRAGPGAGARAQGGG